VYLRDRRTGLNTRAKSNLVRLIKEYDLVWPAGLTDEEAGERAGVVSGYWKRCSELRKQGRITATGHSRTTKAGRSARVYRSTMPISHS
jgi:hypothetical protein